jgi:hypothetical protein
MRWPHVEDRIEGRAICVGVPVRYRKNDIFLIPAGPGIVVCGRAVMKLGTNILVAIYMSDTESVDAVDLKALVESPPVFLVETMDLRIRDGSWAMIGNAKPSVEIPIPVYKTQLEFGGDFYVQEIDGTIGKRLTSDEAASLRRQKSYSPAAVEQAVRAFRGLDEWLPQFDEMRFS